jgi:hypothetical protein
MAKPNGTVTTATEFERYRARRRQRTLPLGELQRPAMAWMPVPARTLTADAIAHRARMLGHLRAIAVERHS